MTERVINKAIFSSRIFSINYVTYPTNHSVMKHCDPVQKGRYYDRVYLFRPDKYEHSVSRIQSGKRVLLSFALNI